MDSSRKALDKAVQLAEIASDWNLSEIEIDGEMVSVYDLRDEFIATMTATKCSECGGTGTVHEWTDNIAGGGYAPYPCKKCYEHEMNVIEARKEMAAERTEHIEALRAAQQCIADFLGVYKNGGSMLIMDLAVNSLKNDALAKIDAVLQPHDGA